MLKHILATSALATVLATGVYAQTDPAADPAAPPPAAPMEGADPAAPMTTEEPAPPDVVEDESTMPGAADTETAAPSTDTMDPATSEENWAPVDLATLSTDDLIGTDIVNADDETIASIEDVIITDDGQVESLVARFGGFLGFGANRVLLTVDEVEVMQDADEAMMVRTSLTPESIEGRPEYEG